MRASLICAAAAALFLAGCGATPVADGPDDIALEKDEDENSLTGMLDALNFTGVSIAKEVAEQKRKEGNDYGYFLSIRRAASLGDPQSMLILGNFYYEGKVIRRSPQKACKWYVKAADAGVIEAQAMAGVMLSSGAECAEADPQKALSYLEQASAHGITWVDPSLGYLLATADSGYADPKRGLMLLESAAKKTPPDANACFYLGMIYRRGGAVEPDLKKALRYFKQATDQGSAVAKGEMGIILAQGGAGVKQDPKKAFSLMQQAVDGGVYGFAPVLGAFYEEGIGTKRDYDEARDLYLQAVAHDSFTGYCRLGLMHHLGHGTPKDDDEAARYYRMAQQHGISDCERRQTLYENGVKLAGF